MLFFQGKCYTYTLILLRDMLGKTSCYSTYVSGNDRHILLFCNKFHFCHLLPFAKVGQYIWMFDDSGRTDRRRFMSDFVIVDVLL